MKRAERPIELEPRYPISWKVVGIMVLAWVLTLVAVVGLRMRMLIILMPVIGVLLVVYLTVCTVIFLKNRK
ncbi:MAG: hypothetical protein ABII82_03680 [Verrucomicrobiota bacterium]